MEQLSWWGGAVTLGTKMPPMNKPLAALLLASLVAPHAVDAGGPVRSFDPERWVSPDGWLFCCWARREKGRREAELGVWCIETSEPDAAQPEACWFTRSSLARSQFRASLFLVESPSAAGSVPRCQRNFGGSCELDAPKPGNKLAL